MAKPRARIAVIQFCLGLGILAVLGRAAQLQLVQGKQWAAEAEAQRTVREVRPARRGTMYDRNGVPLALTQEFFHVGIAPNEVADRRQVAKLAAGALGLPVSQVERDLRTRRYAYYHGPFTATQVEPMRGVRGIHLDGDFLRFYPSRDLARPIIGRLGADSARGASGLELALDSLLTGEPGEAVVLKDHRGRRYDSPSRLVRDPVPGHDVVLTIDAELQEIAERELDDAVQRLRADGGDVVILDVKTGELLALASRQVGAASAGAARASTFTDTYEPGSTAKLFAAAALLSYGKADSTDTVSPEDGRWEMPVNSSGRTRTITDSHIENVPLTLAHAIQVSSNIATVKFALRLTPQEQYQQLRDFGFGSPTGAEFPSESRGRFAPPERWANPQYTRASWAMGYEIGVTPVQLAAAYAAIANDGVLLTPTLVREVRDAGGQLLYAHQPEPVRRAVTPEVAATLRDFLRDAAGEGGTGEKAQLRNYTLLGKTGTALRNINGRYQPGQYTASFASIFPADAPEVVVIVKIDSPREGSYYGAQVSAPITRTILEQALASRRIVVAPLRAATPASAPEAAADAAPGAAAPSTLAPVVVAWPAGFGDSTAKGNAGAGAAPATVPAVVGTPVRQALLALHRRGLRVALHGLGAVTRTEPAAGATVPAGTTVTVWATE
ncbi:MAG TPA: penicillin-binding transpeptidase domain-containing protein [Gemmatimonadales bacterium]|nr:penicillin-binding transpeptidase domain-containing protein [Gemmatimonadales bacterium]